MKSKKKILSSLLPRVVAFSLGVLTIPYVRAENGGGSGGGGDEKLLEC